MNLNLRKSAKSADDKLSQRGGNLCVLCAVVSAVPSGSAPTQTFGTNAQNAIGVSLSRPETGESRSTTGLLPKFMLPAVRLCIKAKATAGHQFP